MNQGVHTVDLMRWLCGPLKSVSARMQTAAHERIEVEDLLVATLEFANGALGTLLASTALYPGFAAGISVYGTQGSAVIEGDRLKAFAINGEEAHEPQEATAHAVQIATGGTRSAVDNAVSLNKSGDASWVWGDAHRAQLLDFVRACRGEQDKPLVDGEQGRNAAEVVHALYASAKGAGMVSFPLNRS